MEDVVDSADMVAFSRRLQMLCFEVGPAKTNLQNGDSLGPRMRIEAKIALSRRGCRFRPEIVNSQYLGKLFFSFQKNTLDEGIFFTHQWIVGPSHGS